MKKAGLSALGFVLAGVVLWLVWEKGIKGSIEKAVLAKVESARLERAAERATDTLMRVDTVYRTQLREYPVYRDRVIEANPDNKPLAELAGRCDQVILSCADRVRAADVLIDTLRAQVAALKKAKAKQPQRLSAYIMGGMDFLHTEPLVQAGAETRIAGPLSVTGYIESMRRNDADKTIATRGVLALKFSFR